MVYLLKMVIFHGELFISKNFGKDLVPWCWKTPSNHAFGEHVAPEEV
jgi:hypothetical protein